MPLTIAQQDALKADFANHAAITADVAAGNTQLIADFYNGQASPDFYVWRTGIGQEEVNGAVDWAEVVTLTTNELLSFMLLKDQDRINGSVSSIRTAFAEIFKNKVNTRDALVALAKRSATYAEKLFATGGDGSEATPATMGYEGPISSGDVAAALARP